MKIAITGATGHIGSNLVPLLLEEGHSLKLLIFQSDRFTNEAHVEIIRGDVTHAADVDQLVEGSDMVIHLAAKITIEDDRDGSVTRTNVEGTRHVVESCVKYGIKRLIHFSSIHAFDPHPRYEPLDETRGYSQKATYYDASKIAAEKLVLEAM
ncbi:MAG: NAD-dependent epimerase/dehydratase family protein, partial [Bacteroidota bacterium]